MEPAMAAPAAAPMIPPATAPPALPVAAPPRMAPAAPPRSAPPSASCAATGCTDSGADANASNVSAVTIRFMEFSPSRFDDESNYRVSGALTNPSRHVWLRQHRQGNARLVGQPRRAGLDRVDGIDQLQE